MYKCIFILLGFYLIGCVQPISTFEKIPPGIWRGVLLLERAPIQKYGDDRDITKKFDVDTELPFNFEVVETDTTFYIVIHNGEERIEVRDVIFGRDKATAKDTVLIRFPIYDSYIKAIYEDGVMEGDWVVNYKDNYKIPFKAVHGLAKRFEQMGNEKPVDFAGNWNCQFELGTTEQYPATGIFEQKGDTLTGTFLTETGDYRYLEGRVVGEKLYLSAFDGAHAFMFIGKQLTNGDITGLFRSGNQYITNWEGKRSKDSHLKNAWDMTIQKDQSPLHFSFKNESNKTISINDPMYANKIKFIQIMGTWCPNCMDETAFLKDYFAKNPSEDVALISLGFERYQDEAKCLESLHRFKTKMSLDHEVLYAGNYKDRSPAQIPQISKILSYPTLIITDKSNKIVGIHTGFSGPATPEYAHLTKEITDILATIRTQNKQE